ncbi:MAG: OmpA family protein [Cytophagales bacterium]|nr:OmpA family protein [Cytophagales bacterium]
MKRLSFTLLVSMTACLVACGTKVPLTEPAQVEDRKAQQPTRPAGNTSPTNNTGNVGVRNVPSVAATSGVNERMASVVYFDFDSYVIKPEAQSILIAQAKRLTANAGIKISLAGHTDDLGGREYNLALGQKRADAVKRALAILGVSEAQMEAVSFGKESPASAGTDDAARAKNRRVEVAAR